MKRFLTFVMAVIVAVASIPFAAATKKVTPVVMVSGFGATALVEDGEAVFPPSINTILNALGINEELTLEKAIDELEIWFQDEGYVVQLSAIVERIIEAIRVNDDGSSTYDLKPVVSGAENTSLAAFKLQDMLDYVPYTGSEFLDMESIAQRVGDENVFNFMYDWRVDYDVVADEFKAYIDDVLELTGAEKVSIYSISQGCLVVGQYLYKYADLEQTDKVVFDTPVLGGASFVTDILSDGSLTLNFPVILDLLSDILHIELKLSEMEKLVEFLEGEWIAGAIDIGKNIIVPPMKGCVAFWQMVPAADFDEYAAIYLDSQANAKVIEAVRNFHNGFMGKITETFENATAHGSEISIKACSGFPLVTNSEVNSDAIVDVQYSCGAICAPYGETFPDGYVQAVDNGKNSISPDRTIDLSAGYWPHRTWVVEGLYHGQVEWCPRSLALVETLLFTDEIMDAYSSYEFPQFMQSEAPTSDLSIRFANTNSNFLLLEGDREEYTMTLKNVSKEKTFVINSIECDNGAVNPGYSSKKILLPGESLNVAVTATQAKSGEIKVTYSEAKNIFKTSEKTFGITVLENYSGATAEDTMPGNSNLPVFIRYLISVIKNLFAKIVSLFQF
ncbi:MAG: hypothetical protein E7516_10105 [Ruminococcaceae bacterium]|nr:hypothetical protein [Oscillospiraceae bacterium]